MELPKLFKKTSTGAIQTWCIWTEGNVIKTAFGQLDGKIQETSDTINEGKNTGRSNATTAEQQAELEARSYFDKKKQKNYVEDLSRAKNDETDIPSENGIDVILAHTYAKQGHKIKYPAYIQKKFDGLRCIAIVDNGVATLWTRTRKPIYGLPHIQRELERMFPDHHYIFDGEGFTTELVFEDILSYARQEEPKNGCEQVEYHIYDLVNGNPYKERLAELTEVLGKLDPSSPIKLVETKLVGSEDEAMELTQSFIESKYEGSILRNANGLYVGKRSYDLQKLKSFEDAEFDIVGFSEGRAKLQGSIGSFILKTAEGITFNAKLKGDLSYLKTCFEHPEIWQNKRMTVQYQGMSAYNVPRFPVAIRIREDE